jgi:hypothetical protein
VERGCVADQPERRDWRTPRFEGVRFKNNQHINKTTETKIL